MRIAQMKIPKYKSKMNSMTSKNWLCYVFLFRVHLSLYRLSCEQNVLVCSCGQKKVKNILTFSKWIECGCVACCACVACGCVACGRVACCGCVACGCVASGSVA